jgi:GNAT superfamily N-acetyltransferase
MLTVTKLDVTDPAGLQEAHAVLQEVVAHDTPDEPQDDFATFAAQIAKAWAGQQRIRYIAHLDGEPSGFAALALTTTENRGIASIVKLITRPAARRRGVGRALFDATREHAAAEGRVAIVGGAEVAIPGGTPRPHGADEFARAMGAAEAMRVSSSRLDLADPELPTRIEAALERARSLSDGYSLITWRDRVPDEYAGDVAALYSRSYAYQPIGTLGLVPEHYDVQRLRALEQSLADHGCRWYCAAARHESTGRVVGFTEISVRGPHAWQGLTIVDPAHRGHKLGLLAKAGNASQTREAEPELRRVGTTNNEVNSYILDINREIGYRPHCLAINYRYEVTAG